MKLGLGTVQFGIDYGISNTDGQVSGEEVDSILRLASERGIRVLDSASTYGNSEEVLGQHLHNPDFHIVTKTPLFKQNEITEQDAKSLKDTLEQSLNKLKVDSVYGLLVHHAQDLLRPNGRLLVDALNQLVSDGKVQKVGFSAYTMEEIEPILGFFVPDLVQIPLNVLDQRLIRNGGLEKLKSLNVEIHSRSAFLQGLLLMEPEEIDPYFQPILPHLSRYFDFLKNKGLGPLEGALSFAMNQGSIDTVLAGVCSRRQLEEILEATQKAGNQGNIDFSEFAIDDPAFIDPSQWKLNH